MNKFIGIRYSLILMLLPLVIIIVVLTGVFSIYESRSALTVLANRHIAFKAEELRDFSYSEWETLKSLSLENNAELQAAAKESIISYSRSLLRNKSEKVFIFNEQNDLIWEMSLSENLVAGESEVSTDKDLSSSGWLRFTSDEEERVGILFDFEPFGWSIIFSDLDESFFAEIRNIERNSVIILIVSILAVLILTPLSLSRIVGHIEDLSRTAIEITESRDFSRRVNIESSDETGQLAEKFNAMLETLQDSNKQLEIKSRNEREARKAAEDQEREALFLLSRISDIRDENTGNHLKRIGVLSELMGKLLGLSEKEQEILLKSAPLHDIGKIAVPDSILLKPGKLTEEEFDVIRTHTTTGYKLLHASRSIYLQRGAVIARSHHEKWDGTGYPEGLSGENIPLYGRIVSLVDVFDALLSERPYKKSHSYEETYELIQSQKGKHFDPSLVDLFTRNSETFMKTYDAINKSS
ncbi:MAG: HD domain-containing protein [Spirochaetales bacterium]|nr:HD domain-containing protein [Spirochaetales bacterium]